MKFSELMVGDTFNVSSYRGTKINDHECIIIDSALYDIGDLVSVLGDPNIIPISTLEQSRLALVALGKLEEMKEIKFKDGEPYWVFCGEYL